jgi:hypothetical protein
MKSTLMKKDIAALKKRGHMLEAARKSFLKERKSFDLLFDRYVKKYCGGKVVRKKTIHPRMRAMPRHMGRGRDYGDCADCRRIVVTSDGSPCRLVYCESRPNNEVACWWDCGELQY